MRPHDRPTPSRSISPELTGLERAASAVEYALLVSVVVVMLIVALDGFGETAASNLEDRGGHVGNPDGLTPTD